MSSRSKNLYTGITNDVYRRAMEHQHGESEGFTRRYRIERLVHYEIYDDALEAIAREKQIKAWTRAKRVALIETLNPTWQDLSEGWGEPINYSKLQIPRCARDDTRVKGDIGAKSIEHAPAVPCAGAPEGAHFQSTTAAVKPEDDSE